MALEEKPVQVTDNPDRYTENKHEQDQERSIHAEEPLSLVNIIAVSVGLCISLRVHTRRDIFALLGAVFLKLEYWKGVEATFPLGILPTFICYIHFWHQVIRGVSAVDGGVEIPPFILGVVILALMSGALVSKFGYYAPMMIFASIITLVGVGLLTTWTVNVTFSQWVGY
ncbi:hypothetical protein F4814DRAFT_453855 [Daldinia grandis]|nr:hypothetical protein F4814DRAFT_453855 [Daldinia grandis]